MSTSNLDSQDRMRSKDVNKVARGEQAPRPPHEYGQINRAPSKKSQNGVVKDQNHDTIDHDKTVELGTTPADVRFPTQNQARHCYTRYLEYHLCLHEKGLNAPECEKFAKYYRSICPDEWVEKWNEERKRGVFPGPT